MKLLPVHQKPHDDSTPVVAYQLYCEGCNRSYVIPIVEGTHFSQAKWSFNGSLSTPTFNPSLHIKTGVYADPSWQPSEGMDKGTVCHTFIREGHIQYLGDCTHHLANQTVELKEVEQWPENVYKYLPATKSPR